MADQVVSITATNPYMDRSGDNVITIEWTSATGGAVSCNIASTYAGALPDYAAKPTKITGFLRAVETDPDGTTAPSADYDIELNDPNGYDIVDGNLADRSDTDTEVVVPTSPIYCDFEIALAITNAGDEKKGVVKLFLAND